MTVKTADIRKSFLDYFVKHDHKLVPSAPVVPFDDPTILFNNAGMNQFKDVFTGKTKSDFPRATSTQKCIRAGGKHNDLDNVGFTARHHTFFEMLGNFSFGDYFKEQAIKYAWDWYTNVLELPKDKLYASVYETDDEAYELWAKIAPELKNGRILRFGKKDNYWSMGDIGPCGPCSEIHFDRGEKYGTGPDDVVNGETDRFVEIWNLVFMQYDQLPNGEVVDLPKPSVDTGAGLERMAAIVQDVDSNYNIDIFVNLIAAVSELTGAKYKDNVPSHHVVADHIRALTFALADGAGISNEGRGYVLRRILRRAARHGRELGAKEPFLYRLVPTLVTEMGDAFPEIREKEGHVANVIKAEEESFLRTLDTGMDLFSKVSKKLKASGSDVVPGDEVFKLYDTYGFPYDLTEIIAREQGLTLDQSGFEKAMTEQQQRSKAAASFSSRQDDWQEKFLDRLKQGGLEHLQKTDFVRESLELDATIIGAAYNPWPHVAIVTDKTPFYVEAGGQIGDTGIISNDTIRMEVTSVVNYQDRYIHIGKMIDGHMPDIMPPKKVKVTVTSDRRWDIMRNHTATHLMHAALRKVLGEHVKQSGSYVGPDRLRFDFSHHQPMTPEEIAEVERLVNEEILKGTSVGTDLMDLDKAKETGAMALFGEKYAEKVRVVSVGGFSKELCGGTHVANVAQIGPFFVTLETGIASGVRRIEAVTGREAQKQMLANKQFVQQVSQSVGRPEAEALDGVTQLRDKNSELQKEVKKLKADLVSGGGGAIGDELKAGNVTIRSNDFGETDRDTMSAFVDSVKGDSSAAVVMAHGVVGEKPAVMFGVSSSAIDKHALKAGDMAKEILTKFGGRGGGRPNFAQGGVAPDTNYKELKDAFVAFITGKIEG